MSLVYYFFGTQCSRPIIVDKFVRCVCCIFHNIVALTKFCNLVPPLAVVLAVSPDNWRYDWSYLVDSIYLK